MARLLALRYHLCKARPPRPGLRRLAVEEVVIGAVVAVVVAIVVIIVVIVVTVVIVIVVIVIVIVVFFFRALFFVHVHVLIIDCILGWNYGRAIDCAIYQ